MSCARCGASCGSQNCGCGNNCCNKCCKASCLKWGFDDCFLRGRCPDGTELDPLNLCEWLKQHETCTELMLVPQTGDGDEQEDSYMQFTSECGNVDKIYVCDFLGLGDLECLRNVYSREQAESCDMLVYSPDCGDEGDPRHNKWAPYHIPDAGTCMMEPDENGYYKVLKKNDCGCIEECNLFAQSQTWEYNLRDSWPDDPDWPFTIGSYDEVIDLKLDEKCPMFGKTDLEVTFQYGFCIQHIGGLTDYTHLKGSDFFNFQCRVVPVANAVPTTAPVDYETKWNTVATSDKYLNTITVQGNNFVPRGSWEWQVSRTVIVPKGKKLYLVNSTKQENWNLQPVSRGATTTQPNSSCSRLHALHVFVKTTMGNKL